MNATNDVWRSPLWSTAAVEHVARSAASRLREASATYGSVDETVVEQRISTMIRALDSAVREGELDRFEDDTAAAVRSGSPADSAPRTS